MPLIGMGSDRKPLLLAGPQSASQFIHKQALIGQHLCTPI